MIKVYFAQKAFIVHGGKLLVVRKSANDPNQPCMWEVPGGRIEAGESLDESICREVFEEVGIRVIPALPFYVWKWEISAISGDIPDTVVAVARVCEATSTVVSNQGQKADDFLGEIRWIPLDQVPDFGWIPNMAPVIEAFLLGERGC